MFHYIAGAIGSLWTTVCGLQTATPGRSTDGPECPDCALLLVLERQMTAEFPLWAHYGEVSQA